MKILVVDDDRTLADLIAFTLRREQFHVIQAFDGCRALELWQAEQPDLIVLDINLPCLDGFVVCQRVRAVSQTPIILLTVRNTDDDIVQGLGLGADDYVLKPFSPRQLLARIYALLRRTGQLIRPDTTQVGLLNYDPQRREVRWADHSPIGLTALEGRLLAYFLLHDGQLLTNEQLIDHVWGRQGGDRDMLRQLIRRLRGKLTLTYNTIESADKTHNFIENIAGLGYGLRLPQSAERPIT